MKKPKLHADQRRASKRQNDIILIVATPRTETAQCILCCHHVDNKIQNKEEEIPLWTFSKALGWRKKISQQENRASPEGFISGECCG